MGQFDLLSLPNFDFAERMLISLLPHDATGNIDIIRIIERRPPGPSTRFLSAKYLQVDFATASNCKLLAVCDGSRHLYTHNFPARMSGMRSLPNALQAG
jgi:hypothetical protein